MARKSQHTFSKRQREQKKAEKAAQKRARRAEAKMPSDPLDENVEGLSETTEGHSEEGRSETTDGPAPIGEDNITASE